MESHLSVLLVFKTVMKSKPQRQPSNYKPIHANARSDFSLRNEGHRLASLLLVFLACHKHLVLVLHNNLVGPLGWERPSPGESVPIELPKMGPELELLQAWVRCKAQELEPSRHLVSEHS
jgi:hypothetical protein